MRRVRQRHRLRQSDGATLIWPLLALLLAGAPAAEAAPPVVAPVSRAAKPTPKPAAVPPSRLTPMPERVVTFAALNKRNGRTESFSARPGEQVSFDRLTIRVRACETTPPWEAKLTGAFLQIDEARRAGPVRLYSGWMYASASLHPLEHPLYDVWVKSCAMSFPATGPDTVTARSLPAEARPSRAKKSPVADSAPAN